MKSPKLLAALALAGLVVIFVYQNAATVEVRFLAWEAAMSRSLLIFLVLAVGIMTGWLLHSYLVHHPHPRAERGRGRKDEQS
jgi:uncharacterized integral membrane protein